MAGFWLSTPAFRLKRFLTLSVILCGLILGYSRVSAPVREWLTGLFSLDYEIPVEVLKAQTESLGHIFTGRGKFEPLKEVRINATLPGVIKEIRYSAGERVPAGAVVATVEAKDLSERLSTQDAAIREAEANIEKAEIELAVAEKQLAILRDLYRKNFIARREVELAEAAAKTARVEKAVAEAQLAQRSSVSAQTRQVLSLAQITARVGGIVTRRWAEPGAPVSEAAPILSIAQAETVKIVVDLKGIDAATIRPGTAAKVSVKVDALPGREFSGDVTQVQELANFSGDELFVEIELRNPDGALKFGMPASVYLSAGEQLSGIFVPNAALVEIHGRSHLYIYWKTAKRGRESSLSARNLTAGSRLFQDFGRVKSWL